MAASTPESGHLVGELPFIRFGDGPRTLVIFPPINDSLQDVTVGPRFLHWYYRRFADEYTVYLVSRKRRLPSGYTTRDMAADYGRAFERSIGSANVVGLSRGPHPRRRRRAGSAISRSPPTRHGGAYPQRFATAHREGRTRSFRRA